jgi:citrate lyase beta subunit
MFLPGSAPDKFAKAMALDIDGVFVDLEDAVAPPLKDEARAKTMPMFKGSDPTRRPFAGVRINSLRSSVGIKDMLTILEMDEPPPGVLLPKIETADEIRWADELLNEAKRYVELYALIETNAGLNNAMEIAAASPRLTCLVFGAVDMSSALGCANSWEPLYYARARAAHAVAAAGIDIVDVPHLDLDDEAGLRHDAEAGQALGFAGKFAIHPKQVSVINEAYTPTPETIAKAHEVIEAFANEPSGLLVMDGKLIEKPVIRSMQRIVAIAKAIDA